MNDPRMKLNEREDKPPAQDKQDADHRAAFLVGTGFGWASLIVAQKAWKWMQGRAK